MMRYALLSDVHANRPALEAVDARRVDARGTHRRLPPGRSCRYAPGRTKSSRCSRRRNSRRRRQLRLDRCHTAYKHCGCRYEDARQEELSHESFIWTLGNTSNDSKRFLAALPFRIDIRPFGGHVSGPTIRLVHGNHALNTVYVTEDRSDEFLTTMARNMGARAGDVVCFGHTHKPWHRLVEGVHFVNTGSVGRPKDGDPRAGYVLLDVTESGVEVEFVRVEYDVEEAARGILASDATRRLCRLPAHGWQGDSADCQCVT